MTDTTTEAVEGLARRIERHAEPMDSIKIKDALDMSAHCGVAMLRALAAERDTLRAELATTRGVLEREKHDHRKTNASLSGKLGAKTKAISKAEIHDQTTRDALQGVLNALDNRMIGMSQARDAADLALIQPTPTDTPRSDAATEE